MATPNWGIVTTGAEKGISIAGWFYSKRREIKARIKAIGYNVPYELAKFLEYSIGREECFVKTGSIVKEAARRCRIIDPVSRIRIAEPLLDCHNKADNLNTDHAAGLKLIIPWIGSYLRSNLEFMEELSSYEQYRKFGFSIGGPVPNELTEDTLWWLEQRLGFDLHFDLTNPHYPLIIPGIKQPFEPKYEESLKTYSRDYGVILRMPNPRNEVKKIIVLMGCKGYGSEGAALALSNLSFLKEINRKSKDRNFCSIVECELDPHIGQVTEIKEVHFAPLE